LYNLSIEARGKKLCIHVTNLPGTISAEKLADLFETTVAYVVFGFDKKEAWIKDYKEEATAERVVVKLNNSCLDGQTISCRNVVEIYRPADLCRHAMNGRCVRNDTCYYKHVPCSNPHNCQIAECYLQHYAVKNRRIVPGHRK
jgi:hypothetical protein